jgi:hypothetical protein
MIAGLPGTGIGGLYYLLASGWMLLREGWSKLNKRHDLSRSKMVKRQIVLALLIVAGMWATGELIGRLLQTSDLLNRLLDLRALSNGKYNLWKTSIFYWTVATLISLYLLMQGMRLALRISGYVGTRRLAIDPPARAALQGQIILKAVPALEPMRGMVSSNQTEEQSLL